MSTTEDKSRGQAAGTRPSPTLAPYYNDLPRAEEEAWLLLQIGAAKAKSPFHTPSIATIAPDGAPSVRTVVLRSAQRDERLLRFHTDRRTEKYAELMSNANCAMHFYDGQKKIQLRAAGHAEIETGTARCKDLWQNMKDYSQACYRQPVSPGAELDDPQAYRPSEANPALDGFENFCLVWFQVTTMQWLYLAAKGHRRAQFDYRGSEPKLTWIAP